MEMRCTTSLTSLLPCYTQGNTALAGVNILTSSTKIFILMTSGGTTLPGVVARDTFGFLAAPINILEKFPSIAVYMGISNSHRYIACSALIGDWAGGGSFLLGEKISVDCVSRESLGTRFV
ncbi:hypothetical protein BS17DRAFT_783030 [Gyrodon lividus]|nr:hypothetical protein BS17DRAFT_783030 [Gyrodon lividus]